jgi:hypothetical protein
MDLAMLRGKGQMMPSVVMAEKNKFGAFLFEHRQQLTRIEQGLASGADTGHGWVMDHQNTEETALARVNQELMQRLDLFTTEPAGGDANAGRLG